MAHILRPIGLARIRRLVGAAGLLIGGLAQAQQFALEGAVVDSRDGSQLGLVSERGELATLFRAQKALTFGILRSAGISLDQLGPELRARIERLQTTNLDAFRAFAQGLDLKDQGRFTEAREQFRRAAELDPGFELATQQQQAMPDVNLGSSVQLRAAVAAAASTAVERGRAVYAVDLARAAAALQSGLTVVALPAGTDARRSDSGDDALRNRSSQSSTSRTPTQLVGLAYTLVDGTISVASVLPGEWSTSEVALGSAGALQAVGTRAGELQFRQDGATATPVQRAELTGGGVAYWGAWLSAPGASATLRTGTREVQSPQLGGRVDWIAADTPVALPGSGSFEFTPRGGSLQDVTGTIRVDMLQRQVRLNDLGFRIDGFTFSGLRGEASYNGNPDRDFASAPFTGRFEEGGRCPACPNFSPTASAFAGHFVGREAGGLVFSTVLSTGNGGTASGVHLFTRPATPTGRAPGP